MTKRVTTNTWTAWRSIVIASTRPDVSQSVVKRTNIANPPVHHVSHPSKQNQWWRWSARGADDDIALQYRNTLFAGKSNMSARAAPVATHQQTTTTTTW
jgi:hypothetical protein